VKTQLFERIREGCSYLDVYNEIWKAVPTGYGNEVKLWNEKMGYGLWFDGLNIKKRLN